LKSSIKNYEILANLPGAERVLEGLDDYRENRISMAACLVRMARPRLSEIGLMDSIPLQDDGAELELFDLLQHQGNQAHSRYNALIRELVSFERALDHRMTQSSHERAGSLKPEG
jgi:hypothetical protein